MIDLANTNSVPHPLLHDPVSRLLQDRAIATWDRIKLARQLDCPNSEQTLTDNNLIEIIRLNSRRIRIYKARGNDEPKCGFDWEWYVGSDGDGWTRYAVQAKKLDLNTNTYKSLRHRVADRWQIDILDEFASTQGAIPLYCFYNAAEPVQEQEHWHCSIAFNPKLLGCSIVPLEVVRRIHDRKRTRRTFDLVHRHPRALPWHCILCPMNSHPPSNLFATPRHKPKILRVLPNFLRVERPETPRVELLSDQYRSELGGTPRWIMVINTNREG